MDNNLFEVKWTISPLAICHKKGTENQPFKNGDQEYIDSLSSKSDENLTVWLVQVA